MPEVKHNFTGGKMNKDLDERLVPNGQYRDALNIEVSTSESSNVGTVQNILGNKRTDDLVGSNFTCVGSIGDDKNNKLYWFISKYNKDIILEYDIDNDITSPVVVDLQAGTQKAVLKFFGNIITGINIIDNLLFWTDNKGEPKKINIVTCKAGTPDINTHTQISFKNNSFTGIACEYLWSNRPYDFATNSDQGVDENYHPPILEIENLPETGKYFVTERKKFCEMLGIPFDNLVDQFGQVRDANNHYISNSNSSDAPGNLNTAPNNGYIFEARHFRNGNLLRVRTMKMWDNLNGIHIRYTSETSDGANFAGLSSTNSDFQKGDVIFGVDVKVDIKEKHITVLKPKPLKALSTKINFIEESNPIKTQSKLFEEKLPRFSYRYKYADGEYSAFAPFTDVIFNPEYTKNTSLSNDASVLYNKDTAYDVKEPYNKAMVNAISSVDLMDFITSETPEDVVEVNILYKQEDSPVIYSVASINHTDFDWHRNIFNGENKNPILGGVARYSENFDTGSAQTDRHWMPAAHGSLNSGRYTVTTENIYAAVPSNQLLRPYDNVPRKALAQEVSGNRIIYGNYLQNYTIPEKPIVSVDYTRRKQNLGSFDTRGLPSIKSQRNYQLGVIYCDEFGRETPVFTSNSGAINIPWRNKSNNLNASLSNQLVASVKNDFPEWVDSVKFYVKENSGEFYNLLMERAWTSKKTYEVDNSEGYLWMSFPSSDRNKISEEDYIVLKKRIDVGKEQVSFENKYKVIDISNEAPDAIKYRLYNLGVVSNDANNSLTVTDANGNNYAKLFGWSKQRPDKQVDSVLFSISRWRNDPALGLGVGDYRPDLFGTSVNPLSGNASPSDFKFDQQEIKKLYLSWFRIDSATGDVLRSSKYKVLSGWKGSSGYVMKLERKITKIDADIAHVNGDSSDTSQTHVHQDLNFQVEKKELIEDENFSGQFFVKISKNQVTQDVEFGNQFQDFSNFNINAKASVFYFQDDIADGSATDFKYSTTGGGPYGLTNYNGYVQAKPSSKDFQRDGGGNTNTAGTGSGTARLSDYAEFWETALNKLDSAGGSRFFVDAMHMASAQSDESLYAKYNCINWSGINETTLPEFIATKKSCWTYPPVKKWFTEVTENDLEVEKTSYSSSVSNYYFAQNAGFTQDKLGVVTTSNLFDQNDSWSFFDDSDPNVENHANVGLRIDGWVGPVQKVNRRLPKFNSSDYPALVSSLFGNLTSIDATQESHVNGLEGFVTTVDQHVKGPRRWFSGMDGKNYGAGQESLIYGSDELDEGRHFMHLSFFAPGQDLHNDSWHFNNPVLYGENTFMDNLQGIWGGGVFTGPSPASKYGSDSNNDNKHYHLAMEGNYAAGEDEDHKVYSTPPGPGTGFGYDLKYRELHERQWDPTFNANGDPGNKIRDFIRNLYPGQKFRFNFTADTANQNVFEEVYTIKKVRLKKIYNHTNWRSHYNIHFDSTVTGMGLTGYNYGNTQIDAIPRSYRTVEDCALRFLNDVDKDGDVTVATLTNTGAASAYGTNRFEDLKRKIVDFGAAHNRRVCYILELDKNPAASNSTNPASNTSRMSADLDGTTFTDIEFLEPVQDVLLSDLNKFPAIWETSPKKEQSDLEIYYEASNNIPVRLNKRTNDLFAPKGCLVEIVNPPYRQSSGEVFLVEWNDNVATLEPGFEAADENDDEINYTDLKFKFFRKDGSYTVAKTGQQQLTGATSGLKTKFIFKPKISESISSGLSWHNCFSFGNGLESNRVRDGFNEMFITNGSRVSATIQETYEQENRKTGLIFSGIYNSNSGINNLNQFIQAENITKDLNPTYGSIQKLFSRNTDLVVFCEDKVVKVLANKDAVFNADGNAQLTANENVLGQTVPFVGEYGISKNPESFASESYRAYFTDKQRGAVLRLSKDGLTPISKTGMHDWFRDNLSFHTSLIGTYDNYKENYNITLSNTYTENIIFNTLFNLGADSQAIDASVLSVLQNGGLAQGVSYSHSYNSKDIGTHPDLVFNPTTGGGPDETFIESTITVKNHPAIPEGHFQTAISGAGAQPPVELATPYNTLINYVPDILFVEAGFGTWNGNANQGWSGVGSGNSLPDDGWYYDPDFSTYSYSGSNGVGYLFAGGINYGDNLYNNYDGNKFSNLRRVVNNYSISESGTTSYTKSPVNGYNLGMGITGNSTQLAFDSSHDPKVEKPIYRGGQLTYTYTNMRKISQCITRNSGNGNITFDRCVPGNNTYVQFDNIGAHPSGLGYTGGPPSYGIDGELNDVYSSNSNTSYLLQGNHNTFYSGDELHIQAKIIVTPTFYLSGNISSLNYASSWNKSFGYNIINPAIEIFDKTTGNVITASQLVSKQWVSSDYSGTNKTNPYTEVISMPSTLNSDFENEHSNSAQGKYTQTATLSDYKLVYDKFHNSGTVHFGNTYSSSSYGNRLPNSVLNWYSYPNLHNTVISVTLGCSFKFRDSSQQDSSGSSISGNSITEAKVVDNLGIRIKNFGLQGSSSVFNWSTGTNGASGNNRPMRNPLWEVVSVTATKGFGIISPHEPFVAGNPGQNVTYYDIQSTPNTQETLTLAAIQTMYPGGALDANGDFVINQNAINAYQQNLANASGFTFNVPAIPPSNVDAFVEVSHPSSANWNRGPGSIEGTGGAPYVTTSPGGQWFKSQISSQFGNNRTAIYKSAVKYQAGDPFGSPTGALIEWYEKGPNPAGQSGQEGNYGNEDVNGNPVSYFNKQITDKDGTIYLPPPEPTPGPAGNDSGTTNHSSTGYGITTQTYNNFVNDWWRIKIHPSETGGYGINFEHPSHPFVTNNWYMVDVELDENEHPGVLNFNGGTPPIAGTGGGEGIVAVRGALSASGFSSLDNLNTYGGYGQAIGGNNHCLLLPKWREVYNQPARWVLRGVFKVEADSFIQSASSTSGAGMDRINLRFYNAHNNAMHIGRIICRNVTYVNGSGIASNWLRGVYDTNALDLHTQINTFTKSKLYYHNDQLCWEECLKNNNYPWQPSSSPNFLQESAWTQDLSSNMLLGGEEWILKFTLGPNGKTNQFSPGNTGGSLGFWITGDTNDFQTNYSGAVNEYTGAFVKDIVDQGLYEFRFTLDGVTTNWSLEKDGNPYTVATQQEYGAAQTNTYAVNMNKLTFFNSSNDPLSCGISDMFLTQQDTIFSGGQAGSWNFTGFDSTTTQFISWDIFWDANQVQDGRLQFLNAPTFDSSYQDGNVVIAATQFVDKVINRYEKYEVSFNFNIQGRDVNADNSVYFDGQGLFHIYYFNSEGYGFRINDIGDENLDSHLTSANAYPNYKKEAINDSSGNLQWWRVSKIVGIGDESVYDPVTGNGNVVYDSNGDLVAGTEDYAYSEFENGFGEALRDTFVIRFDSSANSSGVTGWIDNVSMRRVYPLEALNDSRYDTGPETTISFSEDVNGWTSFKSFIPEGGLSVSKKYFTFKDGMLYQHYKPLKYDEQTSVWQDVTLEEAENYNHFYEHLGQDAYSYSKVKLTINAEPSVVKTFNTLNYEGTQAFVSGVTSDSIITPQNSFGYNDYDAVNNVYLDLEGWKCTEIITDLDNGNLLNFIKKEGKWFGFIKGKNDEFGTDLKTSRFSVQGLGTVKEII